MNGKMNGKQIWAGGMMILAGVNLFLGSLVGYGRTWPLFPIGIGIMMLLAPWTDDPSKRNAYRIGGFWAILAGVTGLLSLVGIHGLYGPLSMIGAGVLVLTGLYQKKKEV